LRVQLRLVPLTAALHWFNVLNEQSSGDIDPMRP
jgi:hypothetical protein